MAERRKKKAAAKKKAPTRGTAPSSADIEQLDKFEPSEEAKKHEPSDVDAMGQDKRREVVGHAYGPSKKSQFAFFAIVGVIVIVLVGGSIAAVNAFDQPEDTYPDEAPWSEEAAANNPPVRSPSGPCGEPGTPPEFEAGTACARERTAEQGPALPGEVPPGGSDKVVDNQKAGSGGSGGSSGATSSAD
jgi:hypothetical protein